MVVTKFAGSMAGRYPEAEATGDPPGGLVAGDVPAGDLTAGVVVPDDEDDVHDMLTTQARPRTAISVLLMRGLLDRLRPSTERP
jgi:hypothetical protein